MSKDPFDEFKKIEELFERVMSGEGMMSGRTGYSVSVKRVGDNTKVDVRGDVAEEEIERLKRKYPDAEISINGEDEGDYKPVEVVEESESSKDDEEGGPRLEEVDEDELEPEELALKRYREKKENE